MNKNKKISLSLGDIDKVRANDYAMSRKRWLVSALELEEMEKKIKLKGQRDLVVEIINKIYEDGFSDGHLAGMKDYDEALKNGDGIKIK